MSFAIMLWKWLRGGAGNMTAGVLVLVLTLLLARHVWMVEPRLRDERDYAEKALAEKERKLSACEATVDGFRSAARAAEAAQAANLVRVAARQDTITREAVDDYKVRLDVLRARYAELAGGVRSAGPAGADPGLSGATAVPGAMAAAGRAGEAPGNYGLPAEAASCTPMSLHERLVASEQAVQLDKLIDAVLAQAQVGTNP